LLLIINMDKMNDLPHRFRQDSFRKYEPFIRSAVDAWPNMVKADPAQYNVAQVTFACRLRDAKRSLYEHHWPTDVDIEKFNKIGFLNIEVSERIDGSVLVGSHEAIVKYAEATTSMPVATLVPEHSSEHIFTLTTKEQKELLMELSARRLLAPRMFVMGLTSDEVDFYQKNYDVALDKHDERTWILI